MWKHQQFPYRADGVNSYNEGRNVPGSLLGNFYDRETF